MDWNSIKVFFAVHQANSIAQAASTLQISESTLFRQLNRLEGTLGKLFERGSGRYTLTQLGERLLPMATAMQSSADHIQRELYGHDKRPSGVVRLTAPSSFAYGLLPEVLDELRDTHPGIEIELLVTNSVLNLSARQADLALRVTHDPPAHFIGKEVAKIGWSMYASETYLKQHAERHQQHGHPPTTSNLRTLRFVGASGELATHPAYDWLDNNLTDSIVVRTNDYVAMLELVRNNQGVAILPNEFKQNGIVVLRPVDEIAPNTLWLLAHPDMRQVERVKIVMHHLLKSLRDRLSSVKI
jgi:DNA-binding transcriptional LysR family regulator